MHLDFVRTNRRRNTILNSFFFFFANFWKFQRERKHTLSQKQTCFIKAFWKQDLSLHEFGDKALVCENEFEMKVQK